MANQIITGLDQNVVFVEDFDGKNLIVVELLVHDMASLIQSISCEIINPDVSKRIPNDKEITLRHHASCGVHFSRSPSLIVDQDFFRYLLFSFFQINFPQSHVPIIATSHQKELIAEC